MEKFSLSDLVEIDWVDSYAEDGWMSRETQLHEPGYGQCHTVGFVLDGHDDWVTVTASYSEHGQMYGFIAIPKVAITHIRVLKAHMKD